MTKITANLMKDKVVLSTATIDFDLGTNLATLVALYGENVVYEHAKDNIVIAAQGRMRAMLKGTEKVPGMRPDAVVEKMKEWKPSVSVRDPAKKVEALTKTVSGMTPEQKAALLKMLTEQDAPAPVVEAAAKTPALRKGRKAA